MSNQLFNHPHAVIPMGEKVAFLKHRHSYPDNPKTVETIETHMSWVFLTDRFAYKLRKPVRFDYLDFSTIDARRRDCEAEVQLNKRLADGVYIDTVPLVVDTDGKIQLGKNGKIIDWLVKSHRLERQQMLDYAINNHLVKDHELYHVAQALVDFYMKSKPIDISPTEYLQRFRQEIVANETELSKPVYPLPGDTIKHITAAQMAFLQHHAGDLMERAAQKHITDAHGDLRPEHICLTTPPVIIDCLEFNREYRLLDTIDELSFLAVDCERLGAPQVGERVIEWYRQLTNDNPTDRLLHFYKSFRACLKAKIAIWHTVDNSIHEHAKWIHRSKEYLHLALLHAENLK